MTNERRGYTAEEVARNDGRDGSRVWVIVHGSVYDVTGFMDIHPGGRELIEEYAGADATEGFDDYGHSSDAKRILKKHEIGTLVESSNENNAMANVTCAGRASGDAITTATDSRPNKRRRNILSAILGPCSTRR